MKPCIVNLNNDYKFIIDDEVLSNVKLTTVEEENPAWYYQSDRIITFETGKIDITITYDFAEFQLFIGHIEGPLETMVMTILYDEYIDIGDNFNIFEDIINRHTDSWNNGDKDNCNKLINSLFNLLEKEFGAIITYSHDEDEIELLRMEDMLM